MVALTRSLSGLAHALKFTKFQVRTVLSSSLQVSLDNPSKVIGRELLVQKVMQESVPFDNKLDGNATLQDSMVSYFVVPVEVHSMASTTADQASLQLTFFDSYNESYHTESSLISLVIDPWHFVIINGIIGPMWTSRQKADDFYPASCHIRTCSLESRGEVVQL
jgi:hypothetical protein